MNEIFIEILEIVYSIGNRYRRIRAQCQDCFEDIVPLVERMRNHHEKCESRQQRPDDSPGPSAPKARKTQGTLGFKSIKPYDQHAYELQSAKTIIATNMSFNSANNPQFQKLIAMLKPNVTVPDRRKIAGPLLDEIFDIEQKKVTAEISGMNATIAIDGWSTITNQPVIGVCIYVHGKMAFLYRQLNST